VVERFGKIDVLFANAGVAKFAPISDSTESLFDELFDINVKGLFFTLQKALPHLNDSASIILNTTFVNNAGLSGTSVYAASKAAVRSFARTAAAELVGRGIRVNAVSPGPILTPIYGRLGLPKEAVDDLARTIVSLVPMKRMGKSEEIASTVLFLASSDSSYITGVEINVDGGAGQV
jgi:NAD(P)-dependent dehydrogenase (short-subunit alcohol dehydrogenase family)